MKLTPARALAPALVVLVLLGGAGCTGEGSDQAVSGSSDSGGDLSVTRPEDADAPAAEIEQRAGPDPTTTDQSETGLVDPALIRHGNVALRADDVAESMFEVQAVVDRYDGQVTEEKTTTDDDGRPAHTRMVLRIPVADFAGAMAALKDVAELESAGQDEVDVTTRVIDTRTRLRAQRRSIDRITRLFGRAQDIRDIMAIEAQLATRQADLDSLQSQATYLANQTTLSTITVTIDKVVARAAAAKDDTGFLSGLAAGWSGLTAFAVALATVAGALLPWLVLLAVVGPPLLLLGRSVRRRRAAGRPERTPSAA